MPTPAKSALIDRATEWYGKSVGVIFTDYRGLSVRDMQELRKSLRQAGAEYRVVKNTLFRIAVGDDIAKFPAEFHNGTTATAFIFQEETACAKALTDFKKTHPTFSIKGGFVQGRALSAAEVEAFAKLPGKKELLAQIVGVMAAPISNVVGIMNELLAAPIRLVAAIEEKGGGAPSTATAQAPEPAPVEAAAEAAPEPEQEAQATETEPEATTAEESATESE
ncbi:MAG: 50S ribosomal protein L10 [Fimbriimonadales bacterium]|nr:50S ribosomal protein L10 [Fimbriimonadales bacterium]NOG92469.1 50S ribosomal protein L10 [Armatimonadota bacterium]